MNPKSFILSLTLVAAPGGLVHAQERPESAADKPSPAPGNTQTGEKPERGETGRQGERGERRDRRDGPGPMSERGGDQDDGLTPQEREQFQKALRETWDEDDVRAAREEWEKAGRKFQKALREAVAARNPGLSVILKKLDQAEELRRGRMASGGPGEDELRQLRPMLNGAPEGRREDLIRAHREIQKNPEYQRALDELKKSEPGQAKFPAMRKVREVYRKLLTEKVPESKDWIPERPRRDRDHNRGRGEGPRPDGPPPPPPAQEPDKAPEA